MQRAIIKSNDVDIDELTEKLVDLKVGFHQRTAVIYGDEENMNHHKENKTRHIGCDLNTKTAHKSIKTVSKYKSAQRTRKPLSNLTNTISNTQSNEININPTAMKMNMTDLAAANYYNNSFQWFNPPNYVPEPYPYSYQNPYINQTVNNLMPTNQCPPIPSNNTQQRMESNTSSDNDSIVSTQSLSKANVEKIQLTPHNLSNEAWIRYSEQLIMAHQPQIVWDAPYVVSGVAFRRPFDLILKVWHQTSNDTKKYFKIYLVHKKYAAQYKHGSDVLGNVIKERDNTVDIDIQVQDICAAAMKHVIIYMYTGHVTVTAKDLIPLYTLVERLKMKGDIEKQLLMNIRTQYSANTAVLAHYLSQSESVEAYSIKREIYVSIIKRAEKKELKHVALHNLRLHQFKELFREAMISSTHDETPYYLSVHYIGHFISNHKDREFARSALKDILRIKGFDGDKCSVSSCIEFLKIMDILCRERADSVSFYKDCCTKIQFEFNPFNHSDCNALHDLSPKTFNSLLVNALHLQKSMIEVAILKYKELNYTKFSNQLKAFNYTTIWNQRSQIYGEESAKAQSKTLSSKSKKKDEEEPVAIGHKPSPSLTPLSGTNNDDISIISPPLIRTPPSPPKSHNMCFSPVASRYRPPKLTRTASTNSLLQPNPNAIYNILDAAIASVEQEKEDVSSFIISPETNIENGARNTQSLKRIEAKDEGVLNPRKNHIISPDFTPEKLVFRSRPSSPRIEEIKTYKAPKINKGCLVETIDKYHSGVAKLYSPPKWRNDKPMDVTHNTNQCILESRIVSTKHCVSPTRRTSLSPKKRGSGGAYCVECSEWRHKFDFTKSQWRNRPRGFRRCKFCTGEIGSDSKVSPSDWSPRRYRLKTMNQNFK